MSLIWSLWLEINNGVFNYKSDTFINVGLKALVRVVEWVLELNDYLVLLHRI